MLNKLYKIFKNNLHLILPISFFAFIFSAIIAGDVLAAGDIQTNFQVPFGEVKTGSVTTIAQYVNAVYKYLVAAGGVLAGIMFAVGGFMYITSAGDSGKAKDGRKYIINAILGLLLLVSSYVVLDTINPNATVLKDIAVKKIDRNALTGSLGCPCNSDSDCDSAVFCSLDPVPFNADYAAPDWVQGIEDTAKFIGEYGDYAVIAVTLGAGIYMALLKTGAKKAITASAKSVVKKMIAKITKAKTALKAAAKQISLKTVTKAGLKVITTTLTKSAKLVLYPILHPVKFATKIAVVGIGITIGIYTLGGFSGFALNLSGCKLEKGDGVCRSKIFKYNLIPHGLGASNVPGYSVGITDDGVFKMEDPPAGRKTYLYNTDGSLPKRESMLGDTDQLYFISEPFGSIEVPWLTFGNKDFSGRVNTDACDSDENHCPCIEWETYNTEDAIFECRKQARCVSGTDIFPGMTDNNIKFCLTGSMGEPCKDDNDCREGNKCVVVPSGGSLSLLYTGALSILDQTHDMIGKLKNQLAEITPTDRSVYALKPPYDYRQMCMPVAVGGANQKIDSECTITGGAGTYCEPGTGIKNVECKPVDVAQNKEDLNSAGLKCESLHVVCHKLENGKTKYDFGTYSSRKKVINHSMVYMASSNKDCYDYYSQLPDLVDKVQKKLKTFANVQIILGADQEKQFLRKFQSNLFYTINTNSIPYTTYNNIVNKIKLFWDKNIVESDQWKYGINNESRYILQENGQCYFKQPLSTDFQLNGKEFFITNVYINLSTTAGEIGSWDYQESSISDNGTEKSLSDYTCGDSNKGRAIKDILWVFYKEN